MGGVGERALAVAIAAAERAGEIALRYYHAGFDVSLKPDRSPVTQADREAEQAIVDTIAAAFPDHGVLGEEFGARGPKDVRWIIDPIDGTRNFVRGIPIWATLIALEEDGEVTVGVVHVPTTGQTYAARRGGGAYCGTRRLYVSDVATLESAFLIHAGLTLVERAGYWRGFLRLVERTERQRGFGDYMGYTLVAEGKADLYAEVDLKPWDLAPCKILVEEAGGVFTDFEGQTTIYNGTALATNGRLHAEALAALRR